jgi:LysR family transcriptional regulator, glycine cleavage system transcriptional activator
VVRLDADEADLAIRYARSAPRGASREIFHDRFYPICNPRLLAGRVSIRSAGDLAGLPLIHFDWFAKDESAPNWARWREMASTTDPRAHDLGGVAFSFREELHAIDAVLAGDGIAILSDVVVADDLAAGSLVKALDLALPGYGFYPVYSSDHPRRAVIETFVNWLGQTA